MSARRLLALLLAAWAAAGVAGSQRVHGAQGALPRVVPNDNRRPAGRPEGRERVLHLVARTALWHPGGEERPGLAWPVFAEEGGTERFDAVPSGGTGAQRAVRAQFDAYNRRDLEAFTATLAPDARLYVFPDSLLYAGHAQLRPVYARLFVEATGLRAVVHDRMVQGRYVIDRETTYGLPGRAPLTGVAISEVRDGRVVRVVRVWFLD